jgi:hypothetical protein
MSDWRNRLDEEERRKSEKYHREEALKKEKILNPMRCNTCNRQATDYEMAQSDTNMGYSYTPIPKDLHICRNCASYCCDEHTYNGYCMKCGSMPVALRPVRHEMVGCFLKGVLVLVGVLIFFIIMGSIFGP